MAMTVYIDVENLKQLNYNKYGIILNKNFYTSTEQKAKQIIKYVLWVNSQFR